MSSNMDESVVSPNKKSVPSSGMFLYLIHGNMIIKSILYPSYSVATICYC